MRADRLVSLVLLLRRHGRMSAPALAAELEVSTRTVLRDMEALSAAGVPVYAERGRHGGFQLLPGFRTELTGLTDDEALALLAAAENGSPARVLGLGPALASAVRKVLDAVPEERRTNAGGAAGRLLLDPVTDLLPRRDDPDAVPDAVLSVVRGAVLAGTRVRLRYAPVSGEPGWRTVDPVGLVTSRGRRYLLALRGGADRTYRLSRVLAAEALPEPARRPATVDLRALWADRCAQFLADGHLAATVRVAPARHEDLLSGAVAVRGEEVERDGWREVEVVYQDLRHAVWALWQLHADAEAVAPAQLREALRDRAAVLTRRYARPRPRRP